MINIEEFIENYIDNKEAEDLVNEIYKKGQNPEGFAKEYNEAINGKDVKDNITRLVLLLSSLLDKTNTGIINVDEWVQTGGRFDQLINNVATRLALKYSDATSIPENSDLNNYTSDGNYRINTSAIASTITHAPWSDPEYSDDPDNYQPGTGIAGRLIVSSLHRSGSVLHVYIAQVASFDRIYYRQFYDSSQSSNKWSRWVRLAVIEELPLANEGDSWED